MINNTYPISGYARPKATADFLKISTVTLWRWEKSKTDFPKSTRISERVSIYNAEEIRAWMSTKKTVGKSKC